MYRKNERKWMKHFDFLLLDLISCQFSFGLAYFVYFNSFNINSNNMYRTTMFVLFLTNLAVIFFFEPFSDVLKRGYIKEFRISFIHVTEVVLFLFAYMFVVKESSSHSRLTVLYFSIFYLFISYITRILWKRHLRKIAYKSLDNSNTSLLILVERDMLEGALKDILNKNYNNYNVAGLCILDEDEKGNVFGDIPVVANNCDVLDYVCREWVDEVLFVCKHNAPYKKLFEGFSEMGITQHIKINVADEFTANVNIVEYVGPYLCLTSSIKMANNTQLFLKRTIDIIGGVFGCLITALLTIIFYPIVQIKSPGPLIYQSERIGKNGKRFKFYKFRSMVINADDLKKDLEKQNFMSDGMMFKVENDPRIIKGYGEFIRKTSLDEFPQFLNVLKGDMSLVGTRPPTPDEWEKYKLHHRVRLSVKPGITGMWQASGRSEITDFEEIVKLDSYYAHNWTLGLDIKLLFKTVISVINRKGSM